MNALSKGKDIALGGLNEAQKDISSWKNNTAGKKTETAVCAIADASAMKGFVGLYMASVPASGGSTLLAAGAAVPTTLSVGSSTYRLCTAMPIDTVIDQSVNLFQDVSQRLSNRFGF